MKYFLVFLCFFSISTQLFSQKIRARIIGKNTKKTIPYCSITNTKKTIGVTSNENGWFFIKDIGVYDSLLISSLGYKTSRISVNADLDSVLYLTEEPVQLAEVKVLQNRISVVGISKRRSEGSFGGVFDSNYELAVFMPNQKSINASIIEVAFYIVHDGIYNTPFRVKFYKNNDGEIGEEINKKDIICKAYKANHWNKFDLTKYKLNMPEEGCFVAMEWLNVTIEKYKYALIKEDKEEKKGFGQVIGMATDAEILSCFYRENQGEWKSGRTIFQVQSNKFLELPTTYTPMMRTTVQY
ncbi:carboxypeptidase-like regulatory domain-containing protein [Arsenicibacter rosenii]|uniref:Carboxypeptidase-like regulatory domain-containing protein n=1 Tax=Arsenicibacter rosenii TaxID=1750698 RepID=A0A1S2VRR7_9BACT|nr:carboxypeptidase-like regulatory domain-containing protein [Arsenicibacter rosenii]OIN60966.1 hypothetical protein BLX24_02465 [Arsenicibacter rosenii]